MKTGIVGLGVVGTANRVGFEQLGHTVKIHDIKFNTNIEDVIDTEIICICVPTPSASNGSCNTSIVKSVIVDLDKLNYQGVIAIRSSTPSTTQIFVLFRFSDRQILHLGSLDKLKQDSQN